MTPLEREFDHELLNEEFFKYDIEDIGLLTSVMLSLLLVLLTFSLNILNSCLMVEWKILLSSLSSLSSIEVATSIHALCKTVLSSSPLFFLQSSFSLISLSTADPTSFLFLSSSPYDSALDGYSTWSLVVSLSSTYSSIASSGAPSLIPEY